MRTSEELFSLFNDIAVSDERIRIMTLEGSRVNPNVIPDIYQDYDITFLVTDVKSFTKTDEWLAVFGDIILMQKPEAMQLFPPDIPKGWFSYLILFSDGVKIDLTLIPLKDLNKYFEQEPLIKVLLDKDGVCPTIWQPSDEPFWVQKPNAAFISDCANEFSFACAYVAKGLLRKELLYASRLFETVLRVELLRMLEYFSGAQSRFPINTGKYDKWLLRFLPKDMYENLLATYRLESVDSAWNSLDLAMKIFEESMRQVCQALSYDCPDYITKVKDYIEILKSSNP